MNKDPVQALLQRVVLDIEALPRPALPLAAALVSLQLDMSESLRDWLLDELLQRADTREVTPAAEAVMRLHAFGPYLDMAFAQEEVQRQYALLKALNMEGLIPVVAGFMGQLAGHLEQVLKTPA